MHTILIKLFIRDSENVTNSKVRTAYGTLGSITGIITNIFLSAPNFIVNIAHFSIL